MTTVIMSSSSKAIPVVIGVDIGGTNTDAAILDHQDGIPRVLAKVKERTSSDVTTGVQKAVLRSLLAAKEQGLLLQPIQVNIGMTHLVNAVVQGKCITKVSVIRICGPVSEELPPFCDFPSRLTNNICGSVHLVHGGIRFDGKHHEPIDENEIREVVHEIREQGIENIVITGVYSPNISNQEMEARDIVLDEFPEASVSLSHEIGNVGLLERENATILNECIKPMCQKSVEGFKSVLEEVGLSCPFYLTQNDGTIISSSDVMRFPVFTFASGPTNSMRGAAFLTEENDAIVVDIGGTTSDVGVLKDGFPREASTNVKVAGVRTNFRMPDVISIGLGGGSYVQEQRSSDGELIGVKVGPHSAGLNLEKESFVFAEDGSLDGRFLTATDVAVAAGLCSLGYKPPIKALDSSVTVKAVGEIQRIVDDLVEKIKLNKESLPVIIVGGGSVLIDKQYSFKGTTKLVIPNHFDVANAIGAALCKISSTSSVVVNLLDLINVNEMEKAVAEAKKGRTDGDKLQVKETDFAVNEARKPFFAEARTRAIEDITDKTKDNVIANGGMAATLEILEKYDAVLADMAGRALEIKVKVVGDLARKESICGNKAPWTEPGKTQKILSQESLFSEKQTMSSTGQRIDGSQDDEEIDFKLHPKEPTIDDTTGEWILNEWDVECIALGAGIYGCGGGGSVHMGRIRTLKCIKDEKRLAVVTPERLLKDPKKQVVIAAGFMCPLKIMDEQGVSSSETTKAVECLQDVFEIGNFNDVKLHNDAGVEKETKESGLCHIANYQPGSQERTSETKIVGLMSCEIGGMNAMEPFLIAANIGLPVVDADCMGRAFPEVQMFIPFMYGKPPYPATIVGSGNYTERSVVLYCPHTKTLEEYLRDESLKNGCSAGLAVALDKDEVLNKTALHTVSSAWRLGDAILRARLAKESVIDAIIQQEQGKHIITGKITDVKRETNSGILTVEGNEEWSGQEILLEFQYENRIIIRMENGKRGECLGSVPDLISIVDSDTAEPIQTEQVKYGLRVTVLLMPSHHLLRHPDALKWVGPQAFHYSEEFKPYKKRRVTQPIPPV